MAGIVRIEEFVDEGVGFESFLGDRFIGILVEVHLHDGLHGLDICDFVVVVGEDDGPRILGVTVVLTSLLVLSLLHDVVIACYLPDFSKQRDVVTSIV